MIDSHNFSVVATTTDVNDSKNTQSKGQNKPTPNTSFSMDKENLINQVKTVPKVNLPNGSDSANLNRKRNFGMLWLSFFLVFLIQYF